MAGGMAFCVKWRTFCHLLVFVLTVASSKYITPKDCNPKPTPFKAESGEFTSPGGPAGYGNNTECTWDIHGPFSAKVTITFKDFDIEYSKDCVHYDSVVVKENCNGTWSDNLGPAEPNAGGFCGNRTEFKVESNCGRVRVVFKSDDSVTGPGFNASYEVRREKQPPVITCIGIHCNSTQEQIAEDDVQIDCAYVGYPPPKIAWRRINGTMPGNKKEEYNGTLRLYNVRESDSGKYECFANNSLGDASAVINLIVREKCKCPKYIKTNWYKLPPYMREKDDKQFQTSIFMLVLEQTFQKCCGNCTNGHGPSKILFTDSNSMKNSIEDVKSNIKARDTISFPIPGKKDDTLYQNTHKFQSIVSSPGIAFIVVNDEPGTSANAVFESVLGGWPILLLTLVMALLSGMIMWALDTWYNPDEFPRSFIKGSGEGFWWAFVTMTTVGYGDRSPRGYFARIFAIIWVLVGIVITSIFTGVVTTSLTAITLSTEVPLYGTKVLAITNSTEYKFGLNKNAKMIASDSLNTIANHLVNRKFESKGALVDTYVAGEEDKFNNSVLRVNKIYDYDSHYGIVFGDDSGFPLTKKSFQTCMRDYVAEKKADFYKIVETHTKPLKKPAESEAVERSSGLFDAGSALFKNSVYICLGLLLFFSACGIVWDYGYMRHWKMSHSELAELEMSGTLSHDMAKKNAEILDSMMEQIKGFYDTWNQQLDEMSEKHEQQQKQVARNPSK